MSAGSASVRPTNAAQRSACAAQRRLGLGRRATHGRTAGGRPAGTAPRRCRVRRGLLQDDVRVGAADAERRDAARRGRRPSGHARVLGEQLDRARGPVTCGVRLVHVQGPGSTPCRSAMTILITPATPAAAWVWPMLDLSEPATAAGRRGGPGRTWRAAPAPRSGRPAWCRCRAPPPTSTSAGDSPALASACRMTRCWDGPLGAVSPLDAPSWLTAEPRTTASTWCPLRRASESRSSSSTPAPSAQPVPSASGGERLAAAVGGDSPRCRLNSMKMPRRRPSP